MTTEYATLDVSELQYHGNVTFSRDDYKRGGSYKLQELLDKGWRVISSTIAIPHCSHGSVRHHFILELKTE
jgi:hypothetical protein